MTLIECGLMCASINQHSRGGVTTHMFKDYRVVQTAQDQYQVLATHQTTGSVMTVGTVESLPDWVQISWEHEEPQRRFSAIGVLKDTSVERLQSKLKRRERSSTSQLHDYEIVRESDDEVVYRTAHTEEHLAFYEWMKHAGEPPLDENEEWYLLAMVTGDTSWSVRGHIIRKVGG